MSTTVAASGIGWRTPAAVVGCGCIIALLSFGPRSALGQFLNPLSLAGNWGRDVLSLALAIQNLLWGIGQPLAGAVADRFGATRVLSIGALLYAAGLVLMAYATTPALLHLSAGVLIGFGLSGCSFNLVIGALGKLLPASWRSFAFGAGTAAGSFGQFLFSPPARALVGCSALMLLSLPLSLALSGRAADARAPGTPRPQSMTQALAEAFGHRSYLLLVLGFFTCGFQLAFITVQLPDYLIDRGLSADIGACTVGIIGLFNIVGCLLAGWLGERMPKRYILAAIYFVRALAVVGFIPLTARPAAAIAFGALSGLLWLSSVPPTSGLVALMFGTRWLAMLYGFAFFSHQVRGFLRVLLARVFF